MFRKLSYTFRYNQIDRVQAKKNITELKNIFLLFGFFCIKNCIGGKTLTIWIVMQCFISIKTGQFLIISNIRNIYTIWLFDFIQFSSKGIVIILNNHIHIDLLST